MIALPDRLGTPWTANGTEIRSVALANKNGLTRGAARYAWGAPDHWETFRALSQTTYRYEHIVTYHIASDRVCHCDCLAGERGISCGHKGAVRLWIEARKAQVAFADEMRDAGQTPYEAHELISA